MRVDGRKIDGVLRYKMPMIASEFSTHKRKNVFELLWLFVNTTPTKLGFANKICIITEKNKRELLS